MTPRSACSAERSRRFKHAMTALRSVVALLAFLVNLPAIAADSLAKSLAALAVADRGSIAFTATDTRLDEALARFTEATGVPVRAEWDALTRILVDRNAVVDWSVRDATPLAALRILAQSIGTDLDRPVVDASQGTLLLTSLPALAGHRETALYDVADIAADPTLLDSLASLIAVDEEEAAAASDETTTGEERAAGERVERLARLLMDHLDPEGWMDFGGSRGRISAEAGRLVVTASANTHRELRRLLADLRDEAPTSAVVRIAVIELDASVATSAMRRLDAIEGTERRAAIASLRALDGARVEVSAELAVRLGAEAIMRVDDATPSRFEATVLARHDRARRSLAVNLDLAMGAARLTTIADFPARGDGAEALLMPAADGRARIVIVEAATRRREPA